MYVIVLVTFDEATRAAAVEKEMESCFLRGGMG